MRCTHQDYFGSSCCLRLENKLVYRVASEEKGVNLDMIQDPPVLRYCGHRFIIDIDVYRIYKLDVTLSRVETPHNAITDEVSVWHRMISHCIKSTIVTGEIARDGGQITQACENSKLS